MNYFATNIEIQPLLIQIIEIVVGDEINPYKNHMEHNQYQIKLYCILLYRSLLKYILLIKVMDAFYYKNNSEATIEIQQYFFNSSCESILSLFQPISKYNHF